MMTANEARIYTVRSMTCERCVLSVREAVSEISGVSAVNVDLATGRIVVGGEGFADEAVAAAVDEAGYAVPS